MDTHRSEENRSGDDRFDENGQRADAGQSPAPQQPQWPADAAPRQAPEQRAPQQPAPQNIPPRPAPPVQGQGWPGGQQAGSHPYQAPAGYPSGGAYPAQGPQQPYAQQRGQQQPYPAHAGSAPHDGRPQQPAHQGSAPQGFPDQRGAAFGHGATQPTRPLGGDARTPDAQAQWAQPAPRKEKKSFGAGRFTAVLLAAALVGGAAGLGGTWAGSALWGGTSVSSASGGSPSNITVNNPGSVNEATAIATQVLPSVVTIDVGSDQGAGSGSGVVLSEDGYVVTNTHVLTLGGTTNDPTIRVSTSDGRIYDAEIVGLDPTYDLAVIKLVDANGLTPIEFADSSELNVGSTSVAVGAPLGLSNTVTTGIISALNRSIEIASSAAPDGDAPEGGEGEGEGGSPWFFDIPGQEEQQQQASESIAISVLQTDAAINPGNSGGALVDSEGRLIGINVAIATAQGGSGEAGSIGVGFAIPSNIVKRVTDEIIADGSATHGLLGASVTPSASVEGATIKGAYIAEVPAGGAADKAGLREGDIVTSFNGGAVGDAVDLTAQVRAAAAGSEVPLTYVRDGEEHEVTVTLGTLE